jgi:hypothetical protein
MNIDCADGDDDQHAINVRTTLREAAKDVLCQSYTVMKLKDDATVQKVKFAHREAVKFFRSMLTTKSEQQDYRQQQSYQSHHIPHQRIVDGNLYGYNVPSPSKLLFRAYCHEKDRTGRLQQNQPWPNKDFQKASENLVVDLHGLLEECYQQILMEFFHPLRPTTTKAINTGPSSPRHGVRTLDSSPPQKRFRRMMMGDEVGPPINSNENSNNRGDMEDSHSIDDEMRIKHNNENNDFIPRQHRFFFDKSNCPLDYFFYHNQHRSFENCSEHIDRGVLILVCLTDVPGLEVFCCNLRQQHQRRRHTFVCPETLVHNANLYDEIEDSCSDLVCIMAGDQLSRLLEKHREEGSAATNKTNIIDAPDLPVACIHRVRNQLKRARLSISYEVRI